MDQSPGLSFSPLNQQNQVGGGPYGAQPMGPTSSPIQDAIKILSLRIPRAVGASGLAPMGLLNGQGGGGFPGGQSLESLLMRIFGQQGMPGSRVSGGPFDAMPMAGGNSIQRPALPNTGSTAPNPVFSFGSGGGTPGQGSPPGTAVTNRFTGLPAQPGIAGGLGAATPPPRAGKF